MGRNTSLEEIVEGMYEGNWENKEHDEDWDESINTNSGSYLIVH
jgi:hypothetical protein